MLFLLKDIFVFSKNSSIYFSLHFLTPNNPSNLLYFSSISLFSYSFSPISLFSLSSHIWSLWFIGLNYMCDFGPFNFFLMTIVPLYLSFSGTILIHLFFLELFISSQLSSNLTNFYVKHCLIVWSRDGVLNLIFSFFPFLPSFDLKEWISV